MKSGACSRGSVDKSRTEVERYAAASTRTVELGESILIFLQSSSPRREPVALHWAG